MNIYQPKSKLDQFEDILIQSQVKRKRRKEKKKEEKEKKSYKKLGEQKKHFSY